MKKLITLLFALLCVITAFAADVDIIIKTNSEKIEALIQEVSNKEIRYKKANNPNGPLFVIDLEEVSAIMYANGEVQSIEHKAKKTQHYKANNIVYYDYSRPIDGPMQRVGADKYMIDDMLLRGKELNFFLQNNCPIAYTYHKKWVNCENAGWSLLAVGTALFFGAGVGVYVYGKNSYFDSSILTGTICMCVGGAMMSGSIPLIACGNIYKKRTANVFNAHCGQPQAFQPELRLTSGLNGLGLALAF